MQPTDRTGATGDELMVTARQQPQHLPVIFDRNNVQIPMA
jgi:hypothetical protein